MAITVVSKAPVRTDFRLEGGSHPMHVSLAAHVWNVRPGTPIKPTPLGWEIAHSHGEAKAFAVTQGRGGEMVHARKSATFDVGKNQFLLGSTLAIGDIDDTGFVTLVPAEDGPYYAEDTSKVHMSV